jgi:PadR family transcriptional regulator PadR
MGEGKEGTMPRPPGDLEKLILFALLHLGEEAYGASIQREIAARTGREVAVGALYTGLQRLERRGWIRGRMGEPTPERGGRRKKHYLLQPTGARALAEAYEALRRMAAGTETLLGADVEAADA